ncbi:MAG TPA: ATP-binding protein [Solirubrobacteraceae bacterium]|nr:ATP-binding protein [Solirubrobacteraceae bacterium]
MPGQELRGLGRRRTWLDALGMGAALVVALGFVHPAAYYAPTLRAAMETIMTLFALAAAALLREQFHHTHRLRELLLLGAVITLAATEMLSNTLPAALHLHSGSGLSAAYPLGQLVVAAVLVLASKTPSDRIVFKSHRPGLTIAVLSFGAVAAAELVGWLLRGELLNQSGHQTGLQQAVDHPLALAILVLTAGLFLWAAVGFAQRSQREQSQYLQLVGAGALLLAATKLYYLTLPHVTPESVSVRDGLRLLGFGFIFAAALRRDLEMRARATQAAAVAERRRMAQDLHDGLAQDLAFIAAHGAQMSENLGEEHPIAQAARHALAISREAISSLSDVSSATARETMDAIAHELGERFGMHIVTDVSCDAPLTPDSRNEVGRITREAIANAARHGEARNVLVALKQTDAGLVLRVVDDGHGIQKHFDRGDEGFGIRSMRERAAGLGGTLRVRNGRTHGTELEVIFP